MQKFLATFWLIFFAVLTSPVHADHPIFILLTHPRATGTAFEKVMRTCDGIQVLHAPYLDPYLLKKYGSDHPFTKSLPDPELHFEDVTNRLFTLAKKSPIFFKESGYVLLEYLKEHPEFYRNPQIKIAFLVRDPAKSILSFYKKMPAVDESIIGHRQLWELFVLFKTEQKDPLIIDSDEFLKNPLQMLNHLGKHWGLDFKEDNLHWQSGYEEDWHLKDWYIEVANTTELGPYKGDVTRNDEGIPQYFEATNEKDRLRLQELYKIQNVYYQKLLQYAFKPKN